MGQKRQIQRSTKQTSNCPELEVEEGMTANGPKGCSGVMEIS